MVETERVKIAGIMQVRNYNPKYRAFEQLSAICDFTIVLDDNSVVPFTRKPDLLLTRNDSIANWNCTANLTTLFHWAHMMECDYVVRMDDDMLLSEGLSTRDAIEALILERTSVDIISIRLVDLWGSIDEYRIDGIWSQKQFPLITKNWFTAYPNAKLPDTNRRLHQTIFPSDIKPITSYVSYKTIYHTGCMTRQSRQLRVMKYSREDPNGEFQSNYSYMLNENGLMLAGVPKVDRDYFKKLLA